jgi:hypothetical protein
MNYKLFFILQPSYFILQPSSFRVWSKPIGDDDQDDQKAQKKQEN